MNNPFQLVGQAYASQQTGYATHPQQLQNAYNNHLSQAQAAQQAQQMFQHMAQQQRREWVINGQAMTLDEFANTIWPEPCADKTFFYLKYSKESK